MSSQIQPRRFRRDGLRLAALGAALLALALGAGSARAAEPINHPFLLSSSFEGKATPAGSFEDACGIALDSFGDIYVSDYYHHVVDVFGPGPVYLTQLKLPHTNGPCGLAVDSSGQLYVNSYHEGVSRYAPSSFPPSGSTTYGAGTLLDSAHSTALALDPASGELYVDDRTAITEFSSGGSRIGQVELGPLADAYGLAVSDFSASEGDIYVADAASDEIEIYNPGGSLIGTIDGAGTPQAGFHFLLDASLAVDPSDGHLFVADNTQPGFEHPAAVVDEFNAAGAYRGQLPHPIVDAEPLGLAIEPGGAGLYATSGNGEGASVLGFGPAAPGHVLAVAKSGAGAGTVGSEPAGIACGSACAAEYDSGARVTLTAAPAAGSAFAGWTGCATQSGAECTVTLGANRSVEATFEALPPQPLALAAPAPSAARAVGPAASNAALPLAPAAKRHRHRHKARKHRHAKGKGGLAR